MSNSRTYFDPVDASLKYLPALKVAQTVVVSSSGGDFTTIQAAIDSITDATIIKEYSIKIAPGVYNENLIMKPFVNLIGDVQGPGGAIITGTVTANYSNAGELSIVKDVFINHTVGSDGEICVLGKGLVFLSCFIHITNNNNYACTAVKIDTTNNDLAILSTDLRIISTFDGSTKDMTVLEVTGTNRFSQSTCTMYLEAKASSGSLIDRNITGTCPVALTNSDLQVKSTKAGYSGKACCSHVTSVSTDIRIIATEQYRLMGAGSGTAVGMCLVSPSHNAEIYYTSAVIYSTGFTNSYISDTGIGDTQKIWLASTNKDMTKTGLGLAIVTPYALVQTGFVDWSSAAGNYYSFVPATKRFTLLKRATAMFKSSPVVIPANQFVDLPANNTAYFIYADSTGILQTPSAVPDFKNMILLFSIISDGTNYAVSKQFHGVDFPPSVAEEWHESFGSMMTNDGLGILTLLSGASKTLQIVGTTKYHDNGLDTIVPDSAGSAIPLKMFYIGPSGTTINGADFTTIPNLCLVGTTLTTIPNNRFGVFRVGVYSSNNIDDTTPNTVAQYAIVPNTGTTANLATFNSLAAANAAIAANSITSFPPTLVSGLEVIMLGYVVIQMSGAGVGSIPATGVTPAKQVFGANFASGSSSSAGSNVVDTSTFTGELAAPDTSTQLALNRIDQYDSVLDWAINKVYRVGNIVRVTEEGFIGTWRCVQAQSPTTGAFSANLEVDSTHAYWEIVSNSEGSRELVNQVGHGFVAGEVLYSNAGTYAKAKADAAATAEAIGIISGKTTNFYVLAKTGKITRTGWGLSPGVNYYLNSATAGAISNTDPSTGLSELIGTAVSTTTLALNIGRVISTGAQTIVGPTTFKNEMTITSGNLTLSSGNIVVSGTVDGVDVSAHAAATGVHGATTVADKALSLAQFASTTSLELKNLLSDGTGSGANVFADSPVFTTQITAPKVTTASTLTLEATGAGNDVQLTAADDILFTTGGSVAAGNINQSGNFTIGPSTTGSGTGHTMYVRRSGGSGGSIDGGISFQINTGVVSGTDVTLVFGGVPGPSGYTYQYCDTQGSAAPNTNHYFGSRTLTVGGYTSAGAWTLGPSSAGVTHTLNGSVISRHTTNTGDLSHYACKRNDTTLVGQVISSTSNLILSASTGFGITFETNSAAVGSISTAGTWTFGPTSGSPATIIQPGQDDAGDLGGASNRWDDIYATNATIQTSDALDKTDINPIDIGLNFINKLRPVSYKWKGKTRTHHGIIAQDIESAISELGKTSNDVAALIKAPFPDILDEEGNVLPKDREFRYGIRYTELIAPMVKAIQEQQELINSLKARIEALENE